MINAAGPEVPAIRLSRVTKRFTPMVLGLDDISLDISSGTRVVLLGKSGSGKSTLLRHVNRLHSPTSGAVLVHGTDVGTVRGRQLRDLRRGIGMVFQNFHLVGNISALENVCSGNLGALRGPRVGLWMYPSAVRRHALDLLDRVGLAERAYQRSDTLSGGQQQRVAIARALIQQPSVLLADEPVASLDPESSADVLGILTRISKEDRLTVLMSLHQIEYALGFADRIVGLREGRVVLDESALNLDAERAMQIYSAATGTTDDSLTVAAGVPQPLAAHAPARPGLAR
ncbi:phosphonate ABC transporter ATP-binding protein [Actinopolymorpha pittospori]|uniref:Phosphonate transport system ATP-binding protein n=1 Tax=Actinopolymorpha pittospori TaxID=648752 RepID=A0A927N117_9ACTN|nr:phosphonate ABC transporter ATP-binding protein [Actinopolymorpha pittospori]MBE1606987.1 phosphonate transport system ATP-binding protein [Actinopolymorpha pittospori]